MAVASRCTEYLNIPVQIPAYKLQVSVQHHLLGWLRE
jgi:hypothetical protein